MHNFIVIGGGLIGLATAEQLLLHDMPVTLIDQASIGTEASWAGGGILFPLLPWDYPDAVSQLALYSAKLFPDWTETLLGATGIDSEYEQSGMLLSGHINEIEAREWCAKNRISLQAYPGREGHERQWFMPQVAQVRNPRLIKALRQRLVTLGAKVLEHTSVMSLQAKNNRISKVTTTGGEIEAGQVVVAAGAWSKQVLGEWAETLDIYPVRGQILLFKLSPGQLKTIIYRNGVYIIPRKDGHVLVGSTMEQTGFDKSTTSEAHNYLLRSAEEICPSLDSASFVKQWAGLRPWSRDNIPIIDRHPQLENLYVNTGHFRYGVTMAPASARILNNLIFGQEQVIDHTPYSWQSVYAS